MDKILHITLLFDFYGELLTKKQQEVFNMYYLNDLSLSEIALELQISRQGVRDQLKRTEGILNEYEEKLGLVLKFQAHKKYISEIARLIDETEKNDLPQDVLKKLEEIKDMTKKITD